MSRKTVVVILFRRAARDEGKYSQINRCRLVHTLFVHEYHWLLPERLPDFPSRPTRSVITNFGSRLRRPVRPTIRDPISRLRFAQEGVNIPIRTGRIIKVHGTKKWLTRRHTSMTMLQQFKIFPHLLCMQYGVCAGTLLVHGSKQITVQPRLIRLAVFHAQEQQCMNITVVH